MKWDSGLYDERHSFVSEYGQSLADLVDTQPGRRIWDLGCGTGILTHYLARHGATVIGTDLSPDMIRQAQKQYPGLDFRVANAIDVSFGEPFHTVFSNAVFHWIPDQQTLLRNVAAHLMQGGRLVCEMGARGNIEQIEAAFRAVAESRGVAYTTKFFFPSKREYTALLAENGFAIDTIDDFDRPTTFQGEEEGMARWLEQFYASELAPLAPAMQKDIIRETETLLRPRLLHGRTWIGDYRRLRFVAIKK